MKILIMSDIHAMSRELEEVSGAVAGFPEEYKLEGGLGYQGRSGGSFKIEDRSKMTNPVLGVTKALADFESDIDLLLCLGDITHQAKKAPLLCTWHDIHSIAENLGIGDVIGVTGNHDIASRASTRRDIEEIRDFLPAINPPFPSKDIQFNTRYYADGVSSKLVSGCLVIALDTCRLHGLGYGVDAGEDIFENGHLTTRMIEQIVSDIESSVSHHVVIAMHHHPLPMEHDNETPIEKGREFLDAIEGTGKNILVVHGHTHQPLLRSANVHGESPIVFGSGTFSAYPFPIKGKDIANLFHLVEFDQSFSDNALGKILSWERGADNWEQSRRQEIPHEINFGTYPSVDDLTGKILELPKKSYMRESLELVLPELKHMTPVQINEINASIGNGGFRLIIEGGELVAMIYEESI